MYTVRRITLVTLATATLVALFGVLGTQVSTLPAAAATPSWQSTATFTPLANVDAVSCAPGTTTCVAVGDDGGHVASVIVTENDGANLVRCDSAVRRDDAVGSFVPVGSRLLRRRGLWDLQVEQRWRDMDGSRLVVPGAIDLLFRHR